MQTPPLPNDEKQRLEALCSLQVLDTLPEERFDRLTRLARSMFDVPMAIISLVDAERQWFKSRMGLEAEETSRDISFCGHAILSDDLFCIPDALEDERFADNPLVTGPLKIRFYAGVPLSTPEGSRVGTLCILDTKARTFDTDLMDALKDLAACVAEEMNQVRLRNALRELAEQRRYTDKLLNSVSESIIAIDHEGAVRSINPAAQRIFGFTDAEILGQSFTRLMTDADAKKLTSHLTTYLSEGAAVPDVRIEVEASRKDGSTFPAGLTVGKMEIDGHEMFTGIVRDISEQKKLDRMKNEFISTVSHELRTPLTSIMGSLGLIKGGAFGAMSEEVLSMLEIAYASSDRLVRLVNDMLDLDRIESGNAALSSIPVDLNSLAETALTEIAGFGDDFGVKTELARCGGPALVLADPDQLVRAITNLLSNAIKYSPPDGVVLIKVSLVDDCCRLEVTDRGPGIPEPLQAAVFERFTQADTSDTRSTHGAGLGLSIVRAIIDQHQGSVGFETAPGQGTTFHIELPIYNAEHPHSEHAFHKTSRVLVCEDDLDVANLLALILRNAGLEADLALSIAEARDLLATQHYDAMTLDLCLPDGDGIELIQDLREHPKTQSLPIVVVSAHIGEQLDQLDGAAMGIVDWIPKPLDLERVLFAVGKSIQNRFGTSATVLHLEDDPATCRILRDLLQDQVNLIATGSVEAARKLLAGRDFDLVILDLALLDESGEALLTHLRHADGTPIPVVLFSTESPSAGLASRVSATLNKQHTSKEHLAGTILALLNKAPEPLQAATSHGTG